MFLNTRLAPNWLSHYKSDRALFQRTVTQSTQGRRLRYYIHGCSKHSARDYPESQSIRTLKSEIKAAVTAGQATYPIQDSEIKQQHYLQACILEGLRTFPLLTQLHERMVPPEGDVIQGHRIPGGTFIGLKAWGTQLDRVYGDDPEEFRPERWVTMDKERLKATHQTLELVFGHGSTKCLGMTMAVMDLNKMIFEVGLMN